MVIIHFLIFYLISMVLSCLIHMVNFTPIPRTFKEFVRLTFLPYAIHFVFFEDKNKSK